MRVLLSLLLCLAVVSLGFTAFDAEAGSGKRRKKRRARRHHSAKSDKSDKSDKSGRSGKSDKSNRSGKSGKSGCSGKSGKSGACDAPPEPEPENQPPVAKDSNGRFPARGTTGIAAPGLIGNASDPDGDPIVVVDFDAFSALGATVSVGMNGSFGYTPSTSAIIQALPSGQTVTDTFTFTISDGRGGTDVGTVTIVVFK